MVESMPEWERAQNLDDAWSNFDPDTPLESGSPFYVTREDSPLGRLKGALLRSRRPLQYYFSGFKGSGKSTELRRLAADPELLEKYFVVSFSIYDTCDPNDINYVDVLVAVGSQLFESCKRHGYSLNQGIYNELQTWGQRTIERLEQVNKLAALEVEAGGQVQASMWVAKFFAKLTSTLRTEAKTRETLRVAIEPTLSELLEKINLLAVGIGAATKKQVLVVVDDLDKPLPEQTQNLFKKNLSALRQLAFYIIYTVPEWIYLSLDFTEIKPPRAVLLPNIRLHPRGTRTKIEPDGIAFLQEVVTRRMSKDLIEPKALKHAIRMSGGVCRELARIMQMACDSALERDAHRITVNDVERAVSELRKAFRRMLTDLRSEEFSTLCKIFKGQTYRPVERISRMLGVLMVLEYVDAEEENWLDVHPALEEILREWCKQGSKSSPARNF